VQCKLLRKLIEKFHHRL
jgi:hypothetical protein